MAHRLLFSGESSSPSSTFPSSPVEVGYLLLLSIQYHRDATTPTMPTMIMNVVIGLKFNR